MKNNRPFLIWIALYGVLFITGLSLGRWTGLQARSALASGDSAVQNSQPAPQADLKLSERFNLNPKSTALLPEPNPTQIPSSQPMPDRQRNILVIGVDDLLSAEPQLQSVWMILFLKDVPHLMMMPIYPQPAAVSANTQVLDDHLAGLFRLDDEKTPSAEFILALEARDLWWTGYILLDQQALERSFDVIAGDSASTASLTDELLASIQGNLLDSGTVLSSQTRFVQEMCRYSSWLSTSETEHILDLAAHIYPHLRTDLDLEAAVSELKNTIRNGGGISCEFPAVTASIGRP